MEFSYQARNLVNEHGKFGMTLLHSERTVTDHVCRLGRTMIGVFGGDFEELKVTINDAQKIRDAIQRTAGIAFQEAAIGILQGDSKFVNEAISAVIIPYLKDIQSESIKDRELQENKDLEEAYQGQLDWLLPGDSARFQAPERQHSANLKYRHPGTCKWILKTPKYETWRDQQPSSLFHLFGEGGYGKSYLVSTIIEDLVNHISPQPSFMVYFFCKSGDNATQYGVNIMLYLVARLFTICRDEVKKGDDRLSSQNVKYRKIVKIVKRVREKMKNSAGEKDSSSLQIDSVLQPMFVDLAEAINTKLYVIVDALDECCDFAKGLLDTLKTLPEFDIRVLISSRPDDQIRSTLREVRHLEIEVNKETNYADILAYVDESLESMQRFQRFRAGPTIVEKSDGMFKCMFSPIASSYSFTDTSADANLVIESLKQPKALRTNPKQLMNHLPDGMNKLYRQKLQELQEDDRKMLLTALRWLMCSEGEIDSALVADDIEKCFEDHEYSDTDAAIVIDTRVSLGIEAQEGVTNHEDRDSIKRLKEVCRDFLKFSSAAVHIQHQSVRDFVDSEERPQPRDSGMCPACSKRMDQESAYQASQKYGHFKMARRIFKKLMSPSFQDQFIMIRGFDQSTTDTGLVFLFPKRRNIDVSLSDDIQSESSILQSHANIDVHDDTTQAGVESGTKKAELSVQSTAEAEEADPIHGLPDYDSDNEKPPRYELAQWPRHLRAAEEIWPEAQRDAATRERWNKLYNTVEKFLSLETPVYRCWSRRLSLWRQKPPNPLHVAASFGLLKMMERYILHGTNVDVRDENGLTPLHSTCLGSGNVSGIELLVRHGADVNALTKYKGTPLLLLTEGSGSSTMFQYLLDHGAKPDVPDYYGRTCLRVCIFRHDLRRDLRLCEILLRSGMVDVNERDSEGDTPLHWIFYFPNAPLELVTLLLDHGANVNEQNKHSESPLYAACLVGNVPAARVLLDYKADINDDEDVFGRTALHAAVEARKVELVKLLVERGADVYRRDKRGRDCFALAAFEKQVEIIDYLLQTWKSQGATTLHVLTKDLEGNTPLHLGALAGSEKAVDGLLKAGDTAAMCSERNHDGAIPLDSAFEGWKGDYESSEFGKVIIRLAPLSPDIGQNACNVDFAIEKGAVEFIRQIDKPQSSIDIHGWSPTMLAEVCGQYEIASLLLRNVPPATIKDSIPRRKGDFVRSPSRWATTAILNLLVISEDGLEVTYPPGKFTYKPSCVSSAYGQQILRVLRYTSARVHAQTIQSLQESVGTTLKSASLSPRWNCRESA